MEEQVTGIAPDEQLTPAGTRVQQITGAALAVAATLLKFGLIGAGVANPIFGGAAVLSAVLPSFFARKKKVQVVPGPVAASLLGAPSLKAAESVALTTSKPSTPLAAAAMVLTQLVAVLTAILGVLHQLPDWSIFPAEYTVWITLAAAVVAAIIPGLQKIADIFRTGGSTSS